jgi:hypothetical protein
MRWLISIRLTASVAGPGCLSPSGAEFFHPRSQTLGQTDSIFRIPDPDPHQRI